MSADLFVFSGPTPGSPISRLEPDLFAGGGRACVGAQKLAQKALMALLPAMKTAAASGRLRTETAVFAAFAAAAETTERVLRAEIVAGDPPDERIVSLDLTRLTISPGRLILSILMTTEAGADVTLVAPLSSL